MVFIRVIRGRPSGLVQFPAGEAVKICFASVSNGMSNISLLLEMNYCSAVQKLGWPEYSSNA